jgi:hypothetical protein
VDELNPDGEDFLLDGLPLEGPELDALLADQARELDAMLAELLDPDAFARELQRWQEETEAMWRVLRAPKTSRRAPPRRTASATAVGRAEQEPLLRRAAEEHHLGLTLQEGSP